jgi:pyridoxamine 5'-phosphate oxidase
MTGPDHAGSSTLPGEGPMLPQPLPAEPFALFTSWFDEACQKRFTANPNAFALATVGPGGQPAARMVLCKAVEAREGAISFFTNYTSRKSKALESHPRAAATFFWDAFDRQARLEGGVARLPEAESEAYFTSRPWQSRVGAWASEQSQPIASREAMLKKVIGTMRRFGIDPEHPPSDGAIIDIPRPPHWGGWRLVADRVELWLGGVGRVHDRAEWTRPAGGVGPWKSTRLQP